MNPTNSTNLKNRVSKLHLPKTKALLPLFEIISNSIHAIQEKREKTSKNISGKILIKTIRNGEEIALKQVSDIEIYPINSFNIIDNGIGLDKENITSFAEFDSERKAKIGGKGIGRLVCLKAFNKIIVDSIYFENKEFKNRKFEYTKSKNGFDKYIDNVPSSKKNTGTSVILSNLEGEYIKQVPLSLLEIARQTITHFQLYYIQGIEPEIIIKNQDDIEVNLTNLFNSEFEKEILEKDFELGEHIFKVFISKSFKAKSHRIYYCAHERNVKDEGLSKYLEDLKYSIKSSENEEGFYFQVYVVSDFLNKNVNEERTNFNFTLEEDNDEIDYKEITLSKSEKLQLSALRIY